MKVVTVGAMYGRHDTVKYCLDKMPFIDNYIVYSNKQDEDFVKQNAKPLSFCQNSPLSFKWSFAISKLRNIDFDVVIVLGSDDYIDRKFLSFVKLCAKTYDVLCFKDIYFEQNGEFHYWAGYPNDTRPIGAGMCYTKKFLESINYKLYQTTAERGLDSMVFNELLEYNAKIGIASILQQNIVLVDVKDGKGITPITSISNRVLVPNPTL